MERKLYKVVDKPTDLILKIYDGKRPAYKTEYLEDYTPPIPLDLDKLEDEQVLTLANTDYTPWEFWERIKPFISELIQHKDTQLKLYDESMSRIEKLIVDFMKSADNLKNL